MTTEFHGQNKHPDASKKARRGAHLDRARKSRQQDSAARDAEWAALSPREQLAALDMRLGKGLGAKRQREAIAQRIAESKAKPA